MIEKVISGGQTGADRGGLDAAIKAGVPHGGWCPSGRRAEDGSIPAMYDLKETSNDDYPTRTEWNVRDSDGTAIFTFGRLEGGSALTGRIAMRLRKSCLHLDLRELDNAKAVDRLCEFVTRYSVKVLNVAGNRESKSPGIGARVKEIVGSALAKQGRGRVE